jgi:hypothetical protein
MRVENQTKTPVCDSSLCPETSTRIAVQEFHLRTLYSLFEEVAGLCRLDYSDFHNLMGSPAKRCQIILFKILFAKKHLHVSNIKEDKLQLCTLFACNFLLQFFAFFSMVFEISVTVLFSYIQIL